MCPNPEAGGSTTHAGINFQNCVAVLRLAHMLSDVEFGEPFLGKVVSVRSEAPAEVDDVIVTYSSHRKEYIQAKLSISPSDAAWSVMWRHFHNQYRHTDFSQGEHGDFITLAIQWTKQAADLENLLLRAVTSESYPVWKGRLTQPQLRLIGNVSAILGIDSEELLKLCKHLRVWLLPYEIDPLKSNSYENEVRRIVRETVFPLESVFSVLLGLVATTASNKLNLTYEAVVAHLNQRGIKVKRIKSGPISLSGEQRQRLRQNLDGLTRQYELVSERINRVRDASAIETDVERQFRAEKRLEILEAERSQLSEQIAELEQALADESNEIIPVISDAKDA